MPRIPEDKIEAIRAKADIAEVIGRYVALKRSGKQLKGLCPFHQEKTPSFYVNPHRGSYICFGCGVRGDVIEFVREIEGKSFHEAIQQLSQMTGIAVPQLGPQDAHADQKQRERDQMFALTALAARVYRSLLTDSPLGEGARRYLEQRGIGAEVAETFLLGYAPHPDEAGWDTLTQEISRSGLPMDLAETIGLVGKSQRTSGYFDRFRGRLMCPILEPGGSVIGFSGRTLPAFAVGADGEKVPKYMNSPESPLYRKSRSLFGVHAATKGMRANKRVIIVEGNLDVISMHQQGYEETVAPLGTSLTKDQCERLVRFTDRALICFDGDRAGAQATRTALPLLMDAGIEARVVQLPDGEDPDSIDPGRLRALMDRPAPGIEWFVRRMVAAGARDSPDSKGRALRALLPLLRRVKGSDVRGDYAVMAANLLDVPVRRIWAALEGKSRAERSHSGPSVTHSAPMRPVEHAGGAQHGQMPSGGPSSLPPGQLSLTALLVDRPEVARLAEREGVLDTVDDPRLRPIVERVMRAALDGEPMPHEGELLDLVTRDPNQQRALHAQLFRGDYADENVDAQTALTEGLAVARRRKLERAIEEIDAQSAHARQVGDHDALRELQNKKIEIRRQQHELRLLGGA